jgi:hypothetical protein
MGSNKKKKKNKAQKKNKNKNQPVVIQGKKSKKQSRGK